MSAILKITYKDTSFLFMGDAEEESENEILNAGYDLSAQIIKIGHHGSRSSTSLQLLTAVNPKVAVISCGKDNKYGHPNQETLYKLNDQNISYYRTDQNGTVVITSNGTDFEYQIEKQGQKNNPTNAPPQITSTPNSTTSKADIAKEKSNDNVIVYTTKTGECYHKGTCSSLRKSKFETTVREAKADGYRACQNCNPPQ